jgi:hypothetical protein
MNGDLETAPIVDDFVVRLIDVEGVKHVELASESNGRLTWFPGWEHADRDLRHLTPMDVPIGPFAAPFEDADEGWRIVIYEQKGLVHVAATDATFRVPTARYLEAWAALIMEHNPISPVTVEEPEA